MALLRQSLLRDGTQSDYRRRIHCYLTREDEQSIHQRGCRSSGTKREDCEDGVSLKQKRPGSKSGLNRGTLTFHQTHPKLSAWLTQICRCNRICFSAVGAKRRWNSIAVLSARRLRCSAVSKTRPNQA